MTYFEFMQWADFYLLEPFGGQIDGVRHAELQATVANVSGNLKKAVSPSDFMRSSSERSEPESNVIGTKEQVEAWLRG